jgi:hypothetical protein
VKRHEIQTRTVEAQILVEVRCDLCGRFIDLHAEAEAPGQIQHQVTVEHQSVVRMPGERAVLRRVEVDCCGVCFEDKLLVLVEALGYRRFSYEEEAL